MTSSARCSGVERWGEKGRGVTSSGSHVGEGPGASRPVLTAGPGTGGFGQFGFSVLRGALLSGVPSRGEKCTEMSWGAARKERRRGASKSLGSPQPQTSRSALDPSCLGTCMTPAGGARLPALGSAPHFGAVVTTKASGPIPGLRGHPPPATFFSDPQPLGITPSEGAAARGPH